MRIFIHPFVVTVIMALCFSACGSDEELIPVADSSTGVMVAKQSDYMVSQSRSFDDRQILVFPDKESFHQTVEMLKEMTEVERMQYFDSIGFKGAYALLHNANLELDAIFDDESLDSCRFQNEIYKYIDKYNDVLVFNREEDRMEDEDWDVTPSLSFNDENMRYVGSVDGNVVIGNELVCPTSSLVAGPEEIKISIVKTCEVSINHGKYKSFLSIGRKGPYFAFKVQTYRKKGLTIKQDNKCIHYGNFEITDSQRVARVNLKHKRGEYALPAMVKSFDFKVNIKVTDFWDSGHPDEKVSKTFTDVIMK